MSKEGIKIAADVFDYMQKAKEELFRLGCDNRKAETRDGKQDILLAHMLTKANDTVKEDFMLIIEDKFLDSMR